MSNPAYTKLSKREATEVNDDRQDLKEYDRHLATCCAGTVVEERVRGQGKSITHNMDECMKMIDEATR